jgi:hypothetical protein
VEITASRPYKELRRRTRAGTASVPPDAIATMMGYENILKWISSGVILLGIGMVILRING